jgi:hypothetical protein
MKTAHSSGRQDPGTFHGINRQQGFCMNTRPSSLMEVARNPDIGLNGLVESYGRINFISA